MMPLFNTFFIDLVMYIFNF